MPTSSKKIKPVKRRSTPGVLRKRYNLSLEDVAEISGLSTTTIANAEKGRRASSKTQEKLARCYGLSVDDISWPNSINEWNPVIVRKLHKGRFVSIRQFPQSWTYEQVIEAKKQLED